jgi:outer membrane receptor for ferric coprogen and ferric-rhodotorulic acid
MNTRHQTTCPRNSIANCCHALLIPHRHNRALNPVTLFSVLLTATLPAFLLAQTPTPPQESKEAAVQMDPFAVNTSHDNSSFVPTDASSATRIAINLRDMPMAISVMTAAVLNDVMPVSVRDGAFYGAGISGGEFNRNPEYADAVYRNIVTNNMYFEGSPLLQDHIREEPFDIERIEILRGPSGIVFGQGNFGGLANRVSKQPMFTKQSEAEIVLGDNGLIKGAIDLTGPINKHLAYRVVASYSRGPGSDRLDDVFIEDFIHASLTYAPTKNTTFTANIKYRVLNGTANLMGSYLEGNAIDTLYNFDTINYSPCRNLYSLNCKQYMAWFTLVHNVGNWLSFRTLGAITKGNEHNNWAPPIPSGGYNPTFSGPLGSKVPLPDGMMNSAFAYVDQPSHSSGFDQDILVKYKAAGVDTKTLVTFNVAGLSSSDDMAVFYNRHWLGDLSWNYKNGVIGIPDTFNPFAPDNPNYRAPNSVLPFTWTIPKTQPSLTTSIQEFVTLLDGKINLSGGYSRQVQHGGEMDILSYGSAWVYEPDNFSANVIRYGTSVRPISWLTLFAQYNQGFSPPTPRIDPINGHTYGPSTSKDSECGARFYFFNDRLSITGTVFRMNLGGIITPYPNTVANGYFQSGGIIDNGWETTVEGEITPQWSITASVNQCDYVLANGKHNLMSARDYGNLYTKYTFNRGILKNFSIGVGEWYKRRMVDGYYIDSTGAQQERDFPNTMVWGLTMQYYWKPLTFRVSVTNLLNKFYYITESSEIFFRGDSRHMNFSMDYRF